MKPAWPRYILFADATETTDAGDAWRFVLSAVDSDHTIAAQDTEPDACRERLSLMAALRGLEALDQPSLVTIVCPSRYVRRGFDRGLREWRATGWKWERFGRRVWVKDYDLWRRVDRTLEFHRVDCRSWRIEQAGERPTIAAAAGRTRVVRSADLPVPEWTSNRMQHDPALLVVSPPRRARRGVVRFDEPSPPTAACPASPQKVAFAG